MVNKKTEPLTNEIFVDVINYDGYYEISNLGNVKSLERIFYMPKTGAEAVKPEKIIKAKLKKNRLWVQFSLNTQNVQYQLAKLVALHFIKNYNNEPLWFKDNDVKNVSVDNLIILDEKNVIDIFNNNEKPLNNETSLLIHNLGYKRCSVCKTIKTHDYFSKIQRNRMVNNVCQQCVTYNCKIHRNIKNV